MSLLDLVLIALVRGVAEVLPIDPAGHVLLVSKLAGWRPGTIVAAIDFGVVMALSCYLWRYLASISVGLWRLRRGRVEPGSRLLGKILLTALPVVAVQLAFGAPEPLSLDLLLLVGVITLLSALVMLFADRLCMTVKRVEHMGAGGSLALGVAQLLTFVPGVGRVAATVIMGRLLGLERPSAFRFILLSSIPVLITAFVQEVGANAVQGIGPTAADMVAALLSFLLSLIAVALTTRWLERSGLMPFVLYRLVVGGAMVAVALV